MRTDQANMTHSEAPVLAASLELAAAKWKVALHDGRRDSPAAQTVAGLQAVSCLQELLTLIRQQKEKWALPSDARVVASYEAAGCALDLSRATAYGIECQVVDPASIPVERHKRRAKTHRLDAIKLVVSLRAWLPGERARVRVIRVPSAQDEASRHRMRDRGQLQKEVLQSTVTACASYWSRWVAGDEVDSRKFAGRLARGELQCHDGAPLPAELHDGWFASARGLHSSSSN